MKPRCDECKFGFKNSGTNCHDARKNAGACYYQCHEPSTPTFFEPVEPDFEPEYFTALNEKDAEKYIGKVMEFADNLDVRNGKQWFKSKIFIPYNELFRKTFQR